MSDNSSDREECPDRLTETTNDDKRLEKSAQDNQANLLSILDSIDEPVYVVDPETYETLFANRALREHFGEPDHRRCYEFLQNRSTPCPFCTNDRIFGDHLGRSYVWEFRNEVNGRWYKCIDKAIPWPDGRMVRYEMAIDITETKRAENALRESESKLRQVIDLVPHFLFAKDVDGKFIFANEAVAEVYGTTTEDLTGKSDYDFNRNTEEVKHFIEDDKKVIESGTGLFAIEETITDSKGKKRYLETSKIPFTTSGTEKPAMLGVAVDITERKKAEIDRQQEYTRRQREAEIITAVATSNYVTEGAVQELAIALTGVAARAIEVERVGVWFFNEDESQLTCASNYVASSGEHSSGTVLLEHEFRNEFEALKRSSHMAVDDALTDPRTAGYVEAYLKPNRITSMLDAVIRSKGRNLGVLCFEHVDRRHRWQDDEIAFACRLADQVALAISHQDRKLAEEERENLQEQLNQAQRMESVGRLAGGVAHDFNNMLGVILGRTELALEQTEPAGQLHNNLQEIRRAAERSAALTTQLLAFARKQTVEHRVFDLNQSVASLLEMLRRLIGENIDLVWAPGEDLGSVKMDPSQVDQILANLCVNARDAIDDTGKITIETASAVFDEAYCALHAGFLPGRYVMLAVSDDGCGMDPETLSSMFEPFFTTKETGKGTGLGLPMVYGIVKQNSGFINVYSEPGQGTTFRIYLTRHDQAAAPLPKAEPVKPGALRGHETVLLVEDEAAILSLTTTMLERFGYKVLPASTPSEAIRLAEEHKDEIHLLMTDVVMPEMNGRDLARHLQSLYPDLRPLFMSGYTANVIAHRGVLDEGVHFIQKPFNLQDLARKVREALQSG